MDRPVAALPRSRRRAARLVALLAALLWALVVAFVAHVRYGDDVRALLCIGGENTLLPVFASVPRAGPTGYDGHVYAALATDPFLHRFDTQNALDSPAYRATRIMIPLLAWLLALGHAPAAIVWYQLLCWSFSIGAVYLLARWLAEDKRCPWWVMATAASAGIVAAVLRSTPDGAALFFILAALYLHARGRRLPALVVAVAAVLTRETSVLAALAIAADEARRGRRAWAAGFATIPAATGIAWQLYLKHVIGRAFDTGGRNFDLPFFWLPHKLTVVFHGHHVWWMEFVGTLAILATAVAFLAIASKPATWDAPALTFLTFAGLGLFLGDAVYSEAWAYGRALIAVPPLALLITTREPARWRRWVVGSVVILYLLVGVTMVRAELPDALERRGQQVAMWQGTAVPRPTTVARSQALPSRLAVPVEPSLWVLPVANARGRAGASWQTRVAIENPNPSPVRVALELYSTKSGCSCTDRRTVVLGPHQSAEWPNIAGDLFGRAGSGALKLTSEGGQVIARSLTWNATLPQPPTPPLPALSETQAEHTGEPACFKGLAQNPDSGTGIRTNLGLLNLRNAPISFRVEGFDAHGQRLGHFEGRLDPCCFTQVDDLLARFRARSLDGASACVTALTRDASFLAYASVIRGPTAPVVYVFPERRYLRERTGE